MAVAGYQHQDAISKNKRVGVAGGGGQSSLQPILFFSSLSA